MSSNPGPSLPIPEVKPHIPGFWSLIVTQFQGAFSDNAFRLLVIFLVVGSELSQGGKEGVLLIGALFSLPFVLFSMMGGYFADRFSKRDVTIGTKVFEVAVMLLALIGLATDSLAIKVVAVFLMSVQSAIFGPSKYGLLPELLPEKRLSWGNGILELGTFSAIISGTIMGGLLAESLQGRQYFSGLILIGLALFGLVTSLGIKKVPPADPEKHFLLNFVGDLARQLQIIRQDRVLFLAILGNAYFWFLAEFFRFNILFYGIEVLEVSETRNSLLLAAVAIGIGAGSLAAGYLSGSKIEYGLIPLGALGLTVFSAMLSQEDLSFGGVAVNLALLGFSSGFFLVPINALMQHRPAPAQKGGVIAAGSILAFLGVLLSSGVYYLVAVIGGFSPPTIFLISAGFTIGATIYVLWLLPDALLRLLLWLFTHSIYRIRVEGRDHIPDKGGALFVSNHLSFVDALLLLASTDRPIRFIMFKGYYDHPLIKPLSRIMKAIPISSELRPREMIRSLKAASNAIRSGDVVCIFAEGQITRIGQLLPFRRGMERIMKDVQAPIIPVFLDGVWGSIFSFQKGRFLWKIPHRLLSPVTVSFGQPMRSDATAVEVRGAVQELHTRSYRHHKEQMRLLHRGFVSTARRRPFRFAMADARVAKLRWGGALNRTIFLARRLRPIWKDQEMVGILLPPSVVGALVNFAALLTGKIPVNLNYTASSEIVASCAEQCRVQTVITSKAFLERASVTVPTKTVLLEEVAEKPRLGERLLALLIGWTLPVKLLERALGYRRKKSLDDLATVIFSSGSTGDPKGVMLSHYNIGSNLEQLGQIFFLGPKDRVLGILPFFHSFGFTGTLMLPAVLGLAVIYHPNPLDAKSIGFLVSQYGVSFLLATPTFLQAYIRRCTPEQLGGLQFVMAGAEKLPERLAVAFEDKFGLRPFEAYGATECSPAVSVNARDFRSVGFRQVGAKRGTIGHPLPGISVRIVDPDDGEPLPVDTPGLLLVRGPNVMKGYLGKPEKTAAVFRDDWYVTGDIASLDSDGFLTIVDRLSRFSKIGGEMVPHVKVEATLQQLAEVTEQSFAVTGLPDEKKGERLVVLHTLPEEALKPCLEKLPQAGLPKLWTPRPVQFFRVDSLPYLGTGKLDLRRIRELAREQSDG